MLDEMCATMGGRSEDVLSTVLMPTPEMVVLPLFVTAKENVCVSPNEMPAGAVSVVSATEVHEKLRAGVPPVVARIVDDEVWLDVRCLQDAQLEAVARAVANASQRNPGD